MAESLSGTIERVTFHNPDTGFAVLRVQTASRRSVVTVVGTLPTVVIGEQIQTTGSWIVDRQHGEQFKADQITSYPPASIEGMEKYLASGLVKGIGPVYARKIVAAFQERTLDIIDESPAFLREVKGIGPKRIQRIRESWLEQKAVRGIMIFLQQHGVGTSRAVRIYRMYGDRAIEMVRTNPYRLATDIWGIGFKTADELASRLGIERDSPVRARAALRYLLQQLGLDGHVAYCESDLLAGNLKDDLREVVESIPAPILAAAVESERQAGELVRENLVEPPLLYLKPLFLAELGAARILRRLLQGNHPLAGLLPDTAIDWVEGKMGLELAPSQRTALKLALCHKVLVLTGGPGVGKTTLVRGILEIFSAHNQRVLLCAPTGRAAKRLSETTGREARTIHRLLEFDPTAGGFKRDNTLPLDCDLLVVDESSMVDIVLFYQLLKAVGPHACLVLVGDVDQLPSVGPGLVLKEIIRSGVVPVARLTQIFRQAEQSWIVRAAHAVNEGVEPLSAPGGQGDFYFIEASTPEAITERIIALIRDRIPARFGLDPHRDIQVLSPMVRTPLGSESLNQQLQEVLNPPAPAKNEVERFGWRFRLGDKVLQTQNNYQKEVFNGDLGTITRVDETERELAVTFDGREVVYDFGELDELALAYALTIHKSQGSEYPAVIIPLHSQHYMMLQRNLLYTAITRGRLLVTVVGSRQALRRAIGRQETASRCSLLCQRLQQVSAD